MRKRLSADLTSPPQKPLKAVVRLQANKWQVQVELWESGYHKPNPNRERGTTCHFGQELTSDSSDVRCDVGRGNQENEGRQLCRYQPCAAPSHNPCSTISSERQEERRGDGMGRGNLRR